MEESVNVSRSSGTVSGEQNMKLSRFVGGNFDRVDDTA